MDNYPLRLLTFLKIELNQYLRSLNIPYSTPLSRYLDRYNIVEMYLDNILKSTDDSKLPVEVIALFLITIMYFNFVFMLKIICFRFFTVRILKFCHSNIIICDKYQVPLDDYQNLKFLYSLKTC